MYDGGLTNVVTRKNPLEVPIWTAGVILNIERGVSFHCKDEKKIYQIGEFGQILAMFYGVLIARKVVVSHP